MEKVTLSMWVPNHRLSRALWGMGWDVGCVPRGWQVGTEEVPSSLTSPPS